MIKSERARANTLAAHFCRSAANFVAASADCLKALKEQSFIR